MVEERSQEGESISPPEESADRTPAEDSAPERTGAQAEEGVSAELVPPADRPAAEEPRVEEARVSAEGETEGDDGIGSGTQKEEDTGHPGSGSAGATETDSSEHPWGVIDDKGQIHQRHGELFEGRIIGRLHGRTPATALAYFEERFKQLRLRVEELEEQYGRTVNKGRFSERVERLIKRVHTTDAIGDFDGLLRKLQQIRDEVRKFQQEQKTRKEELCGKAEKLAASTSWTKTTEKLKQLQQEWKHLGSSTREDDEALWKRFRGVMDDFFKRRDEDRARRQESRQQARELKEKLCEKAEQLAESTEWEATAKQEEELMAQWKAAGWAGKDVDEALWERFRAARAVFYERRKEVWQQHRGERDANRKRKDELCEAAEALLESPDLQGACEQAKQLQAEWKKVGPVPRAVSASQWQRFRAACDTLFSRAQQERKQRRVRHDSVRRQTYSRKREQAEALRESIARDMGHLERWQHAIDSFGSASSALKDGLSEKISGVEARLAEKRRHLAELEAEIRKES